MTHSAGRVGGVVEHLVNAADWRASRSSGPGGQHRDKASTRAELTVSVDSLNGLDAITADRLAQALGLEDKPLHISVQDERSLSRNQEIAVERLRALVERALAPPPPERRATRPSRASRERRIAGKVRRGATKAMRQRPPADE
jgi:ribosome-associated protein